MNRSGYRVAILSVAILCLIGAGCNRSKNQTGGPAILRYPIIQEPGTLDPARIQDLYTNELWQNVYEGLVTCDAKNGVAPSLAERWDVSTDGKVYTFHLRAAQFQKPFERMVTAEDVKYSLTRSLAD